MLNFNNKNLAQTDIQDKHTPLQFSHCQKKRKINLAQQQGSATQCLLLLSDAQPSDKILGSWQREYNLEDIQVTPWTSNPSKITQNKFICKSKTSGIFCGSNDKENRCQKTKGQNEKQNAVPKQTITPLKQINMIKKCGAIKNSYSSIARYEDLVNQIVCLPTRQFSQTKKQPYFNQLKSSYLIYQNTKAPSAVQRKLLKINKKIDKQNQIIQLMGCGAKLEQNFQSFSLQKNNKVFFLQSVGNSNTSSILKQNNGIVNEATHNTKAQQINNLQLNKQKLVKEFSLEQFQKNNKIAIPNQHQSFDQQEYLLKHVYHKKVNGENSRKMPEYQRIKRKIMQNIQKQAVISSSTLNQFQSRNSKKLLGRYFRHSQQSKKPKGKFRQSSIRSNTNKTQNSDHNYQSSNNPLTKHLYQKYRMLINKDK